ncbi:hypothetical protein [Edaphobacter sp.]|uniref:hypothetical protein n=1 Tax=Edaphobacter sp. TaxID=1934404 RepID=UPI002DB8F19C|nr:hypothetical protein [Edaphobacter sp.]HEU5339723.1 hypothetical protein [Edaphobacter sp.]
MTFDVNGKNIVAGGFGSNFCDNVASSFEFGSVVTGTVAADGSFTLTGSANEPFPAVTIKGTVPQASGESWPGSYAVSLTSPHAPQCDANVSGTFTATSFPLVNGVYVGTGSNETLSNGVLVSTPVTFQVTLQQGGKLTNPVNGVTSPVYSNSVLTGSVRVQGSPCFTSGVTGSTPVSGVEGNKVDARFTMNDGSTLTILGSLTDATETRIITNIAIVAGGQCGTFPPIYQLPELDRQS